MFKGWHSESVAYTLTTYDDKTLITLGWDKYIVVWDIESGNMKFKYPKIESRLHVGCLSHDD